ncbi:acyltransferase family protein [Dyadobacter fermentans]|uniref:Acyltransferase 3 n=1 Tax=Dyadobacter fermentans (strain ATCC 700827 / DSM 18053 / CIP 107007 / KCTC 52180 / NS114) TaxID=471854 RepID=C6W0J6_DYAFD|nr:acyltransferase [Dyadobacter fermentans]ACT93602.1 acyltransferase 3 [Dyadobacter fermentans DSM 18053]
MGQEHSLGRATRESKLNSIQVLRGIAALYVTVYHLKDVMKKGDPFEKEIDFLVGSGPAGVSLFFVISGFIMVYITRNTELTGKNILKFIAKRLIRIWPAYAIVTLAYCFLQSRLSLSPEWPSELVKSLLFIPLDTTPPPFYGYALLNVGWSLNYEIYFYLLIAVSMLFGRLRWYVFFLAIAVTLVGIPTYYGVFTLKADKMPGLGVPYLNMLTNPIIWNFVCGVFLGLAYYHRALHERISGFLSISLVAPAFVCLAIWQFISGFSGGFGPFEWGIGSAAIFIVFVFHYQYRIGQFPAWLVRLGDMSFSVYLLHVPVAVGTAFLFRKMGFPIYSTGSAMFFLTLTLTLIASRISYELIEVRLTAYLSRLLPAGKRLVLKEPVSR